MTLRKDATWVTTDPLGRRVVSLEGIERKRLQVGKHNGPDAMTVSEAKELIERPQMITQSSSIETRYVYYREDAVPSKPPFKRATVSFTQGESEDYDGVLISWSRYSKPVSGKTVWEEANNEDDSS